MTYAMTDRERHSHLKKKLTSALVMLLIAAILLTATSYAWLVLSIAPEVTGISTNIGANGSLEIALLNTDTYTNPNSVRTTVGDSLAARSSEANNYWGNLVDLSFAEYGLGEIVLMPARLNYMASGDGYSVQAGMLSAPNYGFDGRVVDVDESTVSAIYGGGEFAFTIGSQDYGVRAIGTTDNLSVQGSALAIAKNNIAAYTTNARNTTTATMNSCGGDLFMILMSHSMDASATHTDADLNTLKSMLNDFDGVLNYIDLALRQGIVAVAASEISNEDTFLKVQDRVMDSSRELVDIIGDLAEIGEIPEEFATWVEKLDITQNKLNESMNAANALSGGSYTWEQIRDVLDGLMNTEYVYINDTLFKDFDKNSASGLIGSDVEITLASNSGVFADIADFVDNYNCVMTMMGTNITIATASTVDTAYLIAMAAVVKDLEPADNSGEAAAVPLTTTYGYALDLAFRCNAAVSDLLLQTSGVQRVYSDSTAGSTQGGGSYMEFTSMDESYSMDQRIKLMDAVRVGFLDDMGNILAIAKLNSSNRSTDNGVIKAPLYLYEYSFAEDGAMIMGERRASDNLITPLTQNVAKAVTVLVWLDGDIVDNTMVSATEETSLNGVLNLQFASSADLIPANNGELKNITADKTELETVILANEATVAAGQSAGVYTTVSWNKFVAAYNYAVDVFENVNPSDTEVYNAALNLTKAAAGLEVVSPEALNAKISDVRSEMGRTADLAGYAVKDENGNYSCVSEYTLEQQANWTSIGELYRVDYTNNLHDEGNDILTQIYSDESWSACAAALYNAEAAVMFDKATDAQLDAALTALDVAYESLERAVFYKPYDYNGDIYYEAYCDAANADTYGKWYDSDFKRVVADITILNLDAYAEPVDIAEIAQNEYVAWNTETITPYIDFLDDIYPELRDETVKGVKWNTYDSNFFTEVMDQRHVTAINNLLSIVDSENLSVDTSAARALVARTDIVPLAEAESTLGTLEQAVIAALDEKAADAEASDTSMTSEQRILLTAAVNSAKAVEGYNDTAKTELDNLRTATTEVENLLAEGTDEETAASALAGMNTLLTAAGAKEVSAYNTIKQSVPVGSEIYDVVYAVEYPGVTLALTGRTGETSIGAKVLTENGIVFDIYSDITVYTPADGAAVYNGEEIEDEEAITTLSLKKGETAILSASVFYDDSFVQNEIDLGNVVNGTEGWDILFPENNYKFTWSSSDVKFADITGKDAKQCTVTAKEVGTAFINVTVETEEGNFYTASVALTVTE